MISPTRFLTMAMIFSIIVALSLSFVYRYSAINELRESRLQTDVAISKSLPDAIFKRLPADPDSPSGFQTLVGQAVLNGYTQKLKQSTKELKIVSMSVFDLEDNNLLSLGSVVDIKDPKQQRAFERAQQGKRASLLVFSNNLMLLDWLFFPDDLILLDDKDHNKHLHVSYQPLLSKTSTEVVAVVRVTSDVSGLTASILLTQIILATLIFASLLLLNICFAQTIRTGKRVVDTQKAKDTASTRKATHDPLTGLPNRTLLNDRLKQALEQAKRHRRTVVIMFLDLDGFKAVNDSLGHQIGDLLLKAIARRLGVCIREGDTVSRLGGDEFVLVLPLFDSRYSEQVQEVAKRILESITAPMKLKGRDIQLGCSIGVSSYPDDGDDAETLLENADSAMYQAKEQGRNNIQFFSFKPNGAMSPPTNLKSDLNKALQRQEFRLLYQPRIELKSNQIDAVTATLFWMHPSFGMCPAKKFLPTHTKNSPALAVGQWMLRNVCVQKARWNKRRTLSGPVTIHLPPNLFQFQELEQQISEALTSSGLPPDQLELELTQCLLIQDLQSTIPVVQQLSALGVRISLDATEFSPNYLRQLPLNQLSIGEDSIRNCLLINSVLTDKSLGKSTTSETAKAHNGTDAIIVQGAITLAHQLSLPVTATGVDSSKARNYLQSLGCDHIQGLSVAQPLPVQELEDLIRRCTSDKSTDKANSKTDSLQTT